MIRVMAFRVLRFVSGEEFARAESRAAHGYYNRLVEIERTRRDAWRAVRSKYAPGLDEAEAKCAELDKEIGDLSQSVKEARKNATADVVSKRRASGKRGKPRGVLVQMPDSDKARVDALKHERKVLRSQIRQIRVAFKAICAPGDAELERRVTGSTAEAVAELNAARAEKKAAKRAEKKAAKGDKAAIRASEARIKELAAVVNANKPNGHAMNRRTAEVIEEMLEEDWPQAWKDIAVLVRNNSVALKSACSEQTSLYSETKESVKSAAKQSFKESKTDPRFQSIYKRKLGRKFGLRFKKGLKQSDLYSGTNRQLGVISTDESYGRRDAAKRVERTPGSKRWFSRRHTVRMDISTSRDTKSGNRRAVVFECLFDRPVPSDGVVKFAYLVPKRIGERLFWELQLVIDIKKPLVRLDCGEGDCEVRLRWAQADEEKCRMLVAELNGVPFELDSSEYWGAIRMQPPSGANPGRRLSRANGDSKSVRGAIGIAQSMRRASDALFNNADGSGARDRLIAWVERKEEAGQELPDWLLDDVRAKPKNLETHERGHGSLLQTRSHVPLRNIVRRLAEPLAEDVNRLWPEWVADKRSGAISDLMPEHIGDFRGWLSARGVSDPDSQFVIWLEWWRRKDVHLAQVAADLDHKARVTRKQQYRWKARRLTEQYETVTVNKLDLARIQRKGELEGSSESHAKAQKSVVAPSEFVDALKQAFGAVRYRERSLGDEESRGSRNFDIAAE